MHLISNSGDNIRIEQFAAGSVVATTDFEVSSEDFDKALGDLFADEAWQHSVDLPGRTLEVSAHEDGVRISMWHAKNPTRTSCKLHWRDVARYLVN